jgi:hypothetical protein
LYQKDQELTCTAEQVKQSQTEVTHVFPVFNSLLFPNIRWVMLSMYKINHENLI